MADNFAPGYAAPVTFQATGQGNVATLHVTGWNFDEEVLRQIVTHTGHNGVQARLACVRDGKGSFSADLDLDALPNSNPPNIYPGVSGMMHFYVSPAIKFDVPVIIANIPFTSEVQGKVSYQCNVELNAIAGTYTRLN